MKITLPQAQLLKHLQMVEHAVNDRSTLPILSNVLMQTEGDDLVLTATDLDVGIQCRFPITSPAAAGSVALPARRLTTIIRELPDDTVTLEAKKNHTAIVNCGSSSFRIPGLPPEDFPMLPPLDAEQGVVIPQGKFKRLIERTLYAMSLEESRFILNGAYLIADGSGLTVVATDGRRLAVAKSPVTTAGKAGFQVVVPAKTIRELSRLLHDGAPDDVTLTPLKDNQLMFRFGPIRMMTRLIEGQFPQYEKVIPPPSKQIFAANRLLLTQAIRRASLMTTATSQAVVFELGENKLIVSKESQDVGSAREEISVNYNGEPMTIAFNPEFWLEVFKTMDDDDVRVEVSGADKPAVIREPDFVYIVLPMRIS